MSTRCSLLWFSLDDWTGSGVHIYQEAGSEKVYMERTSYLCTAREWNAALEKARKAKEDWND
jgi:hypothetical protein